MISNGINGIIGTSDNSRNLNIYVTDLNISRDFRVRGDLHIGGLMLKIVQEIDVTRDWSDHALWWPARNKWLTHTRSTLDQYRVSPEETLEFTPMHKTARIQLPDLQCVTTKINFSVPMFNSVIEFCKEIGIRHQEELSFKRYIPPEVLVKGVETKDVQTSNTFMISPGLDPYGKLSQSAQNLATLPKNAPVVGQMARSQILPITTSYSSSLNRAGSTPPNMPVQNYGTTRSNASYHPSPFSTLNPNYNLLNNPGLPVTVTNWESTLTPENMDENLVYSPKNVPPEVVGGMLRPRNYVEKAALNAGWLDSSRSLLEQGLFENDLILLRFKYLTFFDLNSKIDAIRINQLYEQAKWAILTEEFDCNESEAYNFSGLQLQVDLKNENRKKGITEPEVDDVDLMLTELENLLEGNWLAKRASEYIISSDPELADYLQFCLPKKTGLLNWRRAFFVLHGLSVHWYNSANDSRGPPMGRIYLRSAEVSYEANVAENQYNIRLNIPSPEGNNEVLLKFDSEQRYAKWLAACQLAARGKTMSDVNYAHEVDNIQSMLSAQHRARQYNQLQTTGATTEPPRNLNPDDYLPFKYSRSYRNGHSTQQRILDAHSQFNTLSLLDSKLQYIKLWQTLREFSLHYFVVRFKNARKPELLIITTNRMIRMGLDGEGPVTVWPFANMKKWHVNWEIRHIFVQMEDEDVEFTCLSADCKVPHEFIGGYIFMSTRSKDKSHILDVPAFHNLTGGWTANE